jgi:hypothetical protein
MADMQVCPASPLYREAVSQLNNAVIRMTCILIATQSLTGVGVLVHFYSFVCIVLPSCIRKSFGHCRAFYLQTIIMRFSLAV